MRVREGGRINRSGGIAADRMVSGGAGSQKYSNRSSNSASHQGKGIERRAIKERTSYTQDMIVRNTLVNRFLCGTPHQPPHHFFWCRFLGRIMVTVVSTSSGS